MKSIFQNLEEISKPEYGHCYEDPILVFDIASELDFMENIIHISGECLLYHRLGAISGKRRKPTDIYEVVTSDGKHLEYLFFHFLSKNKEKPNPPKNFRYTNKEDDNRLFKRFIKNEDNPELKDLMIGSLGINSKDPNFPLGVLQQSADFPEWVNDNKLKLKSIFNTNLYF